MISFVIKPKHIHVPHLKGVQFISKAKKAKKMDAMLLCLLTNVFGEINARMCGRIKKKRFPEERGLQSRTEETFKTVQASSSSFVY